MNWTPESWFILSVALVACVVLMLFAMMCGMGIGALIAWKKTREVTKRLEIMDLLEKDVLPMVKTMHGLLEDTAPKLTDAAGQLMVISHTAREKLENINKSVDGAVERTNVQVKRADEQLTTVLDFVDSSIVSVQRATRETSRQIAAVSRGFRAGMEILQGKQAGGERAGRGPSENQVA